MREFRDVADLPEDERIDIIGRTASRTSGLVGFIVDDEAKADRYIAKLLAAYPLLRVVDRGPGPVASTVLVRISQKGN